MSKKQKQKNKGRFMTEWFTSLTLDQKIALIGLIVAIFFGLYSIFFNNESTKQLKTKGDNSPVIMNTNGNVNITTNVTNQLLKYGDENLSNEVKSKIDVIFNDAKLFSKVIKALLLDLKFLDIKNEFNQNNQPHFLAYTLSKIDNTSEIWNFEVKDKLSSEDLIPSSTSYESPASYKNFIIFSKTTIPKEITDYFNQNKLTIDTYIITPNLLAELIEKSPTSLDILDIKSEKNNLLSIDDIKEYKFSSDTPIRFNFTHELTPLFAYSYILKDKKIIKAYNHVGFRFLLTIFNDSKYPFDISSITAVTNTYTNDFERVLILNKMKGVFKPIELSFKPNPKNNGESNKLTSDIIRVETDKPEIISLTLDGHSEAGLYEIYFRLVGNIDGKNIVRHTPKFYLHIPTGSINVIMPNKNKPNKKENLLVLQVFGYHSDEGAKAVLNATNSEWQILLDKK